MGDAGDFAYCASMNSEKPKLNLNDGGQLGGTGKFKRNKVNRIESELKMTGHQKTDIERKMLLEMKEYNQKKLMPTSQNSTITFSSGSIGKKKNSTMG